MTGLGYQIETRAHNEQRKVRRKTLGQIALEKASQWQRKAPMMGEKQ